MNKNIFSASDKDKLEYFDQLLQSDNTLQEKFNQYLQINKSINVSIQADGLEEYIDNIFEILNGIDISLYMDGCNSYYHYDYEFDTSENLLDSLFGEYEKKIGIAISSGDYYQAMFVVLAIYQAIQRNPSIDDEYGIIYDYADLLLENLGYLYARQFEKIHDIEVSDRKKILSLFIDNIDDIKGHEYFRDLYKYLIDNDEIAGYVAQNINLFYIETQLHILNLLNDIEQYLSVAKQFYKEKDFVADLLLKKLSELNRYDEYEIVAKECFKKTPHYFTDTLMKVIVPEKSEQFYIQLLKYSAVYKSSLDDYKKLKAYIAIPELREIHQKLKERYNVSYYIAVLEYEKYYEEILQFAQENLQVNLKEYVIILIDIYPHEILQIVLEKCDLELKSYDRNRKNYQRMCKDISLIYKKSDIHKELQNYIKTLYGHKPKLPALQDELRKAKLV